MKEIFATAILCFAVSAAQSQAPPAAENDKPKDPHADCPMHKAHAHDDSASTGMNERGEGGMGFSQTATTNSKETPCSTILSMGCRITVSGGQDFSAVGVSSNPATERSPGSSSLRCCANHTTPDAISSLLATIAVGLFWRSRICLAATRPDSKVSPPLW